MAAAPKPPAAAHAAPAAPAAAKPTAEAQLLVRATKLGFYPEAGEVRARAREPGVVFRLSKREHYAGANAGPFQWMEWADTPVVHAPPAADVPPMTAVKIIHDPMSILAPVPSPVAPPPGAEQL